MIRIVEDLGSPALVSAIDVLTDEVAPNWNEWLAYAMTAIGYLGGSLGFGGPFVKNLGVASLPLTVRNIRDRVKTGASGKASRLAFRPSGIRQTTVDEFANVRVS